MSADGRTAGTVEVLVGVVGRAHGIRGEIVMDLRTDEPERRFAVGAALRREDSQETFVVASARDHSGRLLVRFRGVDDRTAAEHIRGARLVTDAPADERPTEAEEFYDRQLVGLRAVTTAGVPVGPVLSVLHLLMQDALEIDTPGGPRLVPFVAELVPAVDLAAGTVTVADLAGLLSETEDESVE